MRRAFFSERVRERAVGAAGVQKGETAADVGAGTGFISEELLRRGLSVIAVDQSIEMLKVMMGKFRGNRDFEARHGVAEKLPIEEGGVDYVFANMYLHHVGSPPAAIMEMVRIAGRRGKVIITDLDEHNSEFLLKEHHDVWMGFKRSDVKRWMEEAGLGGVTVTNAEEECCATSECGRQTAKIGIFLAYGEKP